LICFVASQLGEYSDPFDLKEGTTSTEKESVESTPDVILPLSEDDYSVPYEMKDQKDRHQGKTSSEKVHLIEKNIIDQIIVKHLGQLID